MKKNKILIIIPTYKEKENIPKILEKIFQISQSYDCLVIDDNSPDKTWQVVKKLQKKYRNLHLIMRDFKEGIGPAYICGFKFALENKYEFISNQNC